MDGLNNITLNNTILAGLYAKTLVEIEENLTAGKRAAQNPKPSLSKAEDQFPEVKYLGNNVRSVTILVNNTAHTFLPEDQLSFLTKILGACKLNIGDVAIVNTNNYPDIKSIINATNPSKIILFGVELNTNNIDTASAPAIDHLLGETAQAKALKSKLWGELKKMFGV